MKKFLPIFVLLIIATATILTGCKGTIPTPPSEAVVSGNGGLMATKGEYVYYVNGFESHKNIAETHSNKTGKVEISSINVAKNVGGELKEVQTLVSKVGGYEYSDLYVFGDKLYFLTPSTQKDETGAVRGDIITLSSINLDGKKLKSIYTAEQYKSGKFAMIQVDGKLLALVFDGSKIVKIDLSNDDEVTVLAENVTSAVLPTDKSCFDEHTQKYKDEASKFVYYTRSRNAQEGADEGVGGNIFEKVDVLTNQVSNISSNINTTITVTNFVDDRVYYKKGDHYYSFKVDNPSVEARHTYIAVDGFYPLGKDEQGNQLGVIISYSSKLYKQSLTDFVLPSDPVVSANATFVASDKDQVVYLDESNNLKMISVKDSKEVLIAPSEEKVTIMEGTIYDLDGRYLTFFASVDGYASNYTYMVDINQSTGSNPKATLVGVVQESDVKTESESEEQ